MTSRHHRCHGARAAIALLIASALAANARAQVPGELRGRVTDARTARPIVGARVDVGGRGEPAITSTDGAFVVRGLEPRAYTVRARALGYVVREAEVRITNARTTLVDITLEPTAVTLRAVVANAAATVDSGAVSTFTYDRSAIEASGRRDLAELLRAMPGVVVTQTGGAGASSHVSIRGSSADEVLVIVDGIAVNSVITGDADLSRIALETVERVTVLAGAQSARYGGRALGGVIDVRTRRPDRDVTGVARAGAWGERSAAVSLGGSTAIGARRAVASFTIDHRSARGEFDYDVPVFRGGGTARRVNADATAHQLLGSISLEGIDADLRIRGEWQTVDRGLAGSIVQPSLTGRQENVRRSAGVDGGGHAGPLHWTASADVTREHAAYVDSSPPFGGRYDDVVDASGTTALVSASTDVRGVDASVGGELRTIGVEATTLAPGSPRWQRLLGGWTRLRAARAIGANIGLTADIGARVDGGTLARGTTVSPRVAAVLTRGALSLATSVGSGYAPPSIADQFFHEGVLVRANPDLRAERVHRDVEMRVGVAETRVGLFDVGADVAAYRADVDGMILWLPDFRFIWSPSNFDARRSGWELGARARVPSLGLDAHGTLNRVDIVYANAVLKGQVTYRPRVTASLGAGFTRGSLRADAATRYVGERRTIPGSALNVLEPYWLTDLQLSASRTFGPWSVALTAGVENALDRSASMLVDYPFPGRTWTLTTRLRHSLRK